MTVYILFFSFLVIGTSSLKGKSSQGFLKSTVTFLCVIVGFRGLNVGVDTRGYVGDFHRLSSMSLDMIIKQLAESKEPLYHLGTWFIGQFSSSPTVFLLFWATIPFVSLYFFLRDAKLSANGVLISILCFFALGLFAFYVAGIRQTAAISVVLIAYRSLIKKEIKWRLSFVMSKPFLTFAIWMLVAYNLHNSSLLFLVALPLLKLKVSWWYFPLVIALFFIGNFVKIGFLVEMSAMFFDDRFASYGTIYESSQSSSAFIMSLILFSICYIKRDRLIKKDYRNNYLFNILLVGLVFQSLSGMIYEMARVAFYFSIFYMSMVPKAIEEYSFETKNFLYKGLTVMLLIYLFFLSSSNLPKYTFFS